jgi:hypothetical protein
LFSDERIWGAGAEGFTRIIAEPRRRFVLRADVADQLQLEIFRGNNHPGQLSRFAGRETLRSVTLKNGENALIRAYRHGGVFRWITGKKFFSWPPRPFRELAITEELRRRGVPTVEVYGAGVESIIGPFYRGWLITRELKDSYDLWTALHREGVYHSDLNLKNILVKAEPAGVKGYIIDFDKAVLFVGGLPDPLAKKNLRRLLRSVSKLDPKRQYLPAADWDKLVTWYHDADRESG